jgi:hypothetical protein
MTTRASMAGAWAGGGLVTILAAAELPLLAWLAIGLVVALVLIGIEPPPTQDERPRSPSSIR